MCHMNAARIRAAADTPTPMPILLGSSSRGVTIALVALLECSIGDVVELALAGKDTEGARVTDILVIRAIGVGNNSSPDPTQVENPKKLTNSEVTYAWKAELGMVAGLVTV